MKTQFIELTLVHQNGKHLDTKLWIRADQIQAIANPTKSDTNIREEIHGIVHLINGNCYAVGNFPHDIIEEVQKLDFEK